MDLESHRRFYDYSRARDAMLAATDIPQAPWVVVPSDDKKRARLNCIADLLSRIPYEEIPYHAPKLPPRQKSHGYRGTQAKAPSGGAEVLRHRSGQLKHMAGDCRDRLLTSAARHIRLALQANDSRDAEPRCHRGIAKL